MREHDKVTLHSPIRVLHVLPWITAGGVERRRATVAELSSASFEHRFFTLVADGANADRIRAAGAPISTASVGSLRGIAPFKELMAVVRDYRPHIIHGAVFEGVILAAVVGRLMRVPIVLGEETSDATNRSPRGHFLFKSLAMMTDRTVAISPQVVERLQHMSHIPASKIHLVMNGVDAFDAPTPTQQAVARAHFAIPKDAFVLGTLCRLVDDSHKKVSDAIQAMPLILARIPHARLLICGSGKESAMLQQLAETIGVHHAVTFAGNVDPFQGFAAMDVYAHVASREGFGLSVAEAAFCALPIVTTGVGGIAEIVHDQEHALYVPVGAPEAIARAVIRLYDDPALGERLGQAARTRALENFSSIRYVRDLETLYRQLLEEK